MLVAFGRPPVAQDLPTSIFRSSTIAAQSSPRRFLRPNSSARKVRHTATGDSRFLPPVYGSPALDVLRPATPVALTVAEFRLSKESQRARTDSSLPRSASVCSTIATPPWVRLSCRLRQCDRVPGGVVRVQRTRACNGHWRWVATLLSLRASTKQSMVFK